MYNFICEPLHICVYVYTCLYDLNTSHLVVWVSLVKGHIFLHQKAKWRRNGSKIQKRPFNLDLWHQYWQWLWGSREGSSLLWKAHFLTLESITMVVKWSNVWRDSQKWPCDLDLDNNGNYAGFHSERPYFVPLQFIHKTGKLILTFGLNNRDYAGSHKEYFLWWNTTSFIKRWKWWQKDTKIQKYAKMAVWCWPSTFCSSF